MPNPFLYIQRVLFQIIQFSISTQFSSIWLIDWTLSGATTPGPSGPGNDVNEGVLRIPQSSSISGTSPSDCLVSYPGPSFGVCGVLLCREAAVVLYSPSPLGKLITLLSCFYCLPVKDRTLNCIRRYSSNSGAMEKVGPLLRGPLWIIISVTVKIIYI